MINYMIHCEEIKWHRIVIWLGPNYLGKTIRRQSSRNTSSGLARAGQEQEPGTSSQAPWQGWLRQWLDQQGHHPTTPSGVGLEIAARVPSTDNGSHSYGQDYPAYFIGWPLNQKEERPLDPHLVWHNWRLAQFVLDRRIHKVRPIKVVLGFSREKFAN